MSAAWFSSLQSRIPRTHSRSGAGSEVDRKKIHRNEIIIEIITVPSASMATAKRSASFWALLNFLQRAAKNIGVKMRMPRKGGPISIMEAKASE